MSIVQLCVPSSKHGEMMQNNNYAALKGRKNKQQKDHAVYRNRSPAQRRLYAENMKKKRRAAAAARKLHMMGK